MGSNPSVFTTRDARGNPISPDLNRPVEMVSWDDATNYCAHLTQQEQAAGRLPVGWVYRLPTESEREYACGAGTTTAFHYGNALRGGMANFYDYYEYDASIGEIYVANPAVPRLPRTTTVGSYQPNAWGLYDMHGNLWEWCRDWYGTYPTGSVTDPQSPPSGSGRVVRGGAWDGYGGYCRSAFRFDVRPSFRGGDNGFRVVLAPGQAMTATASGRSLHRLHLFASFHGLRTCRVKPSDARPGTRRDSDFVRIGSGNERLVPRFRLTGGSLVGMICAW